VNWDSSFTSEDAPQRSGGEPLAWHEAQAPVFATRLVAEEKLCDLAGLEKLTRQLKKQTEEVRSKSWLSRSDKLPFQGAWDDLFAIERILSSAEAVRLVPMR
jgi:hypothetical protein